MDILNIWFSPTFILFGYLLYRAVKFFRLGREYGRYFQEKYPDRLQQLQDDSIDWPFDEKKHRFFYNVRDKSNYFTFTSKEDFGDVKLANYKRRIKKEQWLLILIMFLGCLSFGITGFILSWWFPPAR